AISRVLSRLEVPMSAHAAERVEGLIAAAGHAAQLIENYRPEKFGGDIVFFTAGADDPSGSANARTWSGHAKGIVENHVVGATHWSMASADALGAIAEVLNRHQARQDVRG
ncbi:MAG: hypothetical protein QME72_07490, partial [Rhodococcus sp. (in: high G+C Gram-positive bacteria)]